MKTLKEIKEKYAIEQGYEDWASFLNYYGGRHPEWFDQHWKEICILAQKEALKNAAENAWVQMDLQTDWYRVDRTSITNTKNLIR